MGYEIRSKGNNHEVLSVDSEGKETLIATIHDSMALAEAVIKGLQKVDNDER